MSQTSTPDDSTERERISATDIEEGDRVFMGINLHGLTEDVPGTEYDDDIHKAGVEGTVTEALSDREKELLDDDWLPLADLVVETDCGQVFTWQVDNGYVIGYTEVHGRTTDVGKIGGFYTA
jgi:hypothetical protein